VATSVRSLTPQDDLEAVQRLHWRVVPVVAREWNSSGGHGWFRYLSDAILTGLHHVLIVEDTDLVGYAHLSVTSSVAHLNHIGVAPEQRGVGWGRRLLVEALDFVAGMPCQLAVNVMNAAALGLYVSSGFQAAGRRHVIRCAPATTARRPAELTLTEGEVKRLDRYGFSWGMVKVAPLEPFGVGVIGDSVMRLDDPSVPQVEAAVAAFPNRRVYVRYDRTEPASYKEADAVGRLVYEVMLRPPGARYAGKKSLDGPGSIIDW
jgi:ribosomal protein S18 acetylase RimI-like enzyme